MPFMAMLGSFGAVVCILGIVLMARALVFSSASILSDRIIGVMIILVLVIGLLVTVPMAYDGWQIVLS